MSQDSTQKQTRKTVYTTFGVVVLMFGFAFALVPLYNVFCEITGINGKTGRISVEQANTQAVDPNRQVVVQFDATVNSSLPWQFHPRIMQMEVVPGKLYTTEFFARNLSDQSVVGQAIPSVAPAEASLYFNKTECFCFTEQVLEPGQEVWMPVTFRVSSDLPEDVKVMTLSYTFFNKGSLTPEQQEAGQNIHAGTGQAGSTKRTAGWKVSSRL